MGYTPEWEATFRQLRLSMTEFADIAGISQPQMAKIARGQLRREISDDMKRRIAGVLMRTCPHCEQFWENDDGSDPKKATKGGAAR